jgi:hypothetical protein
MTLQGVTPSIAGDNSILPELLGAGSRNGPSARQKPLASLFGSAFDPSKPAPPPEAHAPAKSRPRPRQKIWNLPAGRHCMLVGNCLSLTELRQLAKRTGVGSADMSDYTLHTIVVEQCAERSKLAEAVQRLLDQRHAHMLRQFAKARNGEAVLAHWRDALANGDIAGALWAAWTHPDIGEYESVIIYGELHMLSHQLVERERSERQRVSELERQTIVLRNEAAVSKQELADARLDAKRHVAALEKRLAGHEFSTTRHAQDEIALERAKKIDIQNGALRARNEALSRRLAELEQTNADYARRLAELTGKIDGIREPKPSTAPVEPTQDSRAEEIIGHLGSRLSGRRILCIGGRTGMVDRYRRLVEAGGGHFLHHDGGQEENEHRIDAIVTNADAVVCQVNHVSHSAYWRIKQACKQRQLPCVFVKSGGVTTFARNLEMLIGQNVCAASPARRGAFLAQQGIGLAP